MKRWVMVLMVCLVGTIAANAQRCVQGDCRYGYGKKIFKSGAVYSGQFKNGQIHGKGKLKFSNGSVYEGDWRSNFRQGKGKLVFRSGDTYVGDFQKNRMHGKGVMDFVNGDKYNGAFQNDRKDGYGKYEYHTGDTYEGYFKQDKRSGQGTMTYSDGSRYKGEWSLDKKNGKGTYVDNRGKSTEGRWVAGRMTATVGASGTVTSNSGNNTNTSPSRPSQATTVSQESDEAPLKDCNRHYCSNGQEGIFMYGDGSKYIGEHHAGEPRGFGTIYYKNGDKYTGGWQKHAPHGKGIMVYHDGRRLSAEWVYGKPSRKLDSDEGIIDEPVVVDNNSKVKVWAVLVGVGRYNHMPSLKYTDDDAYKMYAFLKSPEGGALPDEQLRVLIDEDATRSRIIRTMKQVFLKADENDVVMLYFSGHGLKGSFVPYDYDGMKNLLEHTEVTKVLRQSKAKHKMVFADACHSGSMLAMRDASEINQAIGRFYDAFDDTRGGTALILSSKSEETSLEDHGLRQGVFSHFLMKGLQGRADTDGDKVITVTEIFGFVHREVTKYTLNAQTPTISGTYDPRMPVGIVR